MAALSDPRRQDGRGQAAEKRRAEDDAGDKPVPKQGGRDGRPSRGDLVVVRRKALLDAAVKVIATQGLTGITIRMIADAADCSYGVVAFHFESKGGIILAALDHMVEEYEAARARRIGGDARPAKRLLAMVDSDFDARVSNARQIAVWVAFWAETVRVKAYRNRCTEFKERYHLSTLADVAALAAERGSTIDAEQVARTLNAIIDGFWIANLITGNTGAAGQTAGKQACIVYLRSVFPGDF